jgi:transcriptional regulator with XRE-family HTH domain
MDFRERVRDCIRAQNTTQEWIAKKANVSFRTFTGWLQKGREPTATKAVSIARALGTTVEYLVDGTETAALGSTDKTLLAMAKQYQNVLDDLLVLDGSVRNSWVTGIHAAAEEARVRRDSAQAGA